MFALVTYQAIFTTKYTLKFPSTYKGLIDPLGFNGLTVYFSTVDFTTAMALDAKTVKCGAIVNGKVSCPIESASTVAAYTLVQNTPTATTINSFSDSTFSYYASPNLTTID